MCILGRWERAELLDEVAEEAAPEGTFGGRPEEKEEERHADMLGKSIFGRRNKCKCLLGGWFTRVRSHVSSAVILAEHLLSGRQWPLNTPQLLVSYWATVSLTYLVSTNWKFMIKSLGAGCLIH